MLLKVNQFFHYLEGERIPTNSNLREYSSYSNFPKTV